MDQEAVGGDHLGLGLSLSLSQSQSLRRVRSRCQLLWCALPRADLRLRLT